MRILSVGQLRKSFLSISPKEASCDRRGFWTCNEEARERLEQVGRVFLQGYNTALEEECMQELAAKLNSLEPDFRGFGFEGAAMGLTLLDRLLPWRKSRFIEFLNGPGQDHIYMVYVGAGWADARFLPFSPRAQDFSGIDPLYQYLIFDGLAFCDSYLSKRNVIKWGARKRLPDGYAHRAYMQGVGRSLWFAVGAETDRVGPTIARFPVKDHADLWSGVGLACAYAGGANGPPVELLQREAGRYRPALAQGAAFAAKARQRAGCLTLECDRTCRALTGLSAAEAAYLTDAVLESLPRHSVGGEVPAYEIWRLRIQQEFSEDVTGV